MKSKAKSIKKKQMSSYLEKAIDDEFEKISKKFLDGSINPETDIHSMK